MTEKQIWEAGGDLEGEILEGIFWGEIWRENFEGEFWREYFEMEFLG